MFRGHSLFVLARPRWPGLRRAVGARAQLPGGSFAAWQGMQVVENDHRVPELLGERAESSSSLSCRVPTLAAATAAVLAAAAAAAPLSAGPPAEAPAAL